MPFPSKFGQNRFATRVSNFVLPAPTKFFPSLTWVSTRTVKGKYGKMPEYILNQLNKSGRSVGTVYVYRAKKIKTYIRED